jgi:hypothetical protein
MRVSRLFAASHENNALFGRNKSSDEFMGNLLVVYARDWLSGSRAQPPFSSLLALTAV